MVAGSGWEHLHSVCSGKQCLGRWNRGAGKICRASLSVLHLLRESLHVTNSYADSHHYSNPDPDTRTNSVLYSWWRYLHPNLPTEAITNVAAHTYRCAGS